MTRTSLGTLHPPLGAPLARLGLHAYARGRVIDALAALPSAGFLLVDDRGETRIGDGRAPIRIVIHDPRFYERVATCGSVGAGEAYVDGLVSTDDLVGLLRAFASAPDRADSLERGFVRASGLVERIAHALRRNTRSGSRANIAAHYDLGNALFELFLDPSMMYSCAIFEDAGESLERAQERKLQRIGQMLRLRPEDHLLEIGTGWGGMAIHAAKNFGCRVTTTTLSAEQHAYATDRVAREGLADRVTVLLRDYRDLEGTFDKLVSIEMVEAVGAEFIGAYFAKCASLIGPGGLALVQSITIEDHRYEQALRSVDFIKKHVFPGSFIPSASVLVSAAATHGSLRLVDLYDIGPSYALTLARWRSRFLAREAEALALGYDARFIRLWEYYLAYCEAGYLEGRLGNAQMLFARSASAGASTRQALARGW